MSDIRAIFFDLGQTLIYPKESWQGIYLRSTKALTQTLMDHEIAVNPKTFPYEVVENLNQYYVDRDETLREETTFKMLSDLLVRKGYANVPAPVVREALDAKYAITQGNWHLEEDAHEALRKLRLAGYKLALLSNAGDDPDVQTLLDKHKLRQFFSFIRTSAAVGYRKPHTQIFEEALNDFGLFPEQCVMVGDNLDADIRGANELGIYSVWINRRVNKNTKTLHDVHPKAVIQTLTALPDLISNL